MIQMVIKVNKLDERAVLPTRGSEYAAGWDLYALLEPNVEYIEIEGGKTEFIHTGLSLEIPEGYFGAIYARSGLAANSGLRPANCVGVIDSDYRGEIMVALHNDNPPINSFEQKVSDDVSIIDEKRDPDAVKCIEAGQRIAQLIIQKFEDIEFQEADELSDTERDDGGFGSTDNADPEEGGEA